MKSTFGYSGWQSKAHGLSGISGISGISGVTAAKQKSGLSQPSFTGVLGVL